ncbi:MAG: polymer-forming cytoskeletal protein [Bacteroidales bacterium]|jgi:cytoskeletal protein CcmA (bactofilin family)|nr:polymer-forming cytoskeletal protein [Bacteroidales bacterium]
MAKNNNNESSPTNKINIINNNTKIRGDVSSVGDIRIDGILEGNLQVEGKLVVGEAGKIVGDIVCLSADISGTIQGNVKVRELLSLQENATINGDISICKLSIAPGAVFSGKCSMLSEGNDDTIE